MAIGACQDGTWPDETPLGQKDVADSLGVKKMGEFMIFCKFSGHIQNQGLAVLCRWIVMVSGQHKSVLVPNGEPKRLEVFSHTERPLIIVHQMGVYLGPYDLADIDMVSLARTGEDFLGRRLVGQNPLLTIEGEI
jgi:hypothetical protein